MGLSKTNDLLVYDNRTGHLNHEVNLGETYSFKHLNWETQGQQVIVQSTYFKKNGLKCPTVVQAMAFFSIYPLKFEGMFEIESRVSRSYMSL